MPRLLLCGAVLVVPLLLIQNGPAGRVRPGPPGPASERRTRRVTPAGVTDRRRPARRSPPRRPPPRPSARWPPPGPPCRRPPTTTARASDHDDRPRPPSPTRCHHDAADHAAARRGQRGVDRHGGPGHLLRPPGRHLRQPVAALRHGGAGHQPGQRGHGDLRGQRPGGGHRPVHRPGHRHLRRDRPAVPGGRRRRAELVATAPVGRPAGMSRAAPRGATLTG